MLQLWVIPLKQTRAVIKACQAFLDPKELEQASRFVTEVLQSNYIVSHGAMRQILSDYVSVAPSSLRFELGQKGKPGCDGVYFNLSHTRDWAVLAVHQRHEVGVDIECQQRQVDMMSLAKRFFAENEYRQLLEINDKSLRSNRFYNIWTAKEAVIKFTGEGLSRELNSFVVNKTSLGRWTISPLKMGGNNSAALLEGLNLELIELALDKMPHVISVVMSAQIRPIQWQFWSMA